MICKIALKEIIAQFSDALIITSCGRVSREAYAISNKILPLTGSMGMTVAFSIGLALAKPNKKVIAIMGDGDFMMGFNSLLNLSDLKPCLNNLTHIIMADGVYQSTGSQKNIWKSVPLTILKYIYKEVNHCYSINDLKKVKWVDESSLTLCDIELSKDKAASRISDEELPKLFIL